MRKLAIITFLLATHVQAQGLESRRGQEIASYDGRILNIPLVEFNGQYFPYVDIILREDGTWSLDHIGGIQTPDTPPGGQFSASLKIVAREPDDDFNFQVIARISVVEGGCQSVVVLPPQYDFTKNVITLETVNIVDFVEDTPEALLEGCRGTFTATSPRDIVLILDTEEFFPGTYTVKYQDQSADFVVPESTHRNFP